MGYRFHDSCRVLALTGALLAASGCGTDGYDHPTTEDGDVLVTGLTFEVSLRLTDDVRGELAPLAGSYLDPAHLRSVTLSVGGVAWGTFDVERESAGSNGAPVDGVSGKWLQVDSEETVTTSAEVNIPRQSRGL